MGGCGIAHNMRRIAEDSGFNKVGGRAALGIREQEQMGNFFRDCCQGEYEKLSDQVSLGSRSSFR